MLSETQNYFAVHWGENIRFLAVDQAVSGFSSPATLIKVSILMQR
jgi:hypothetical protein